MENPNRKIECPKCGEEIDKTQPVTIRGIAVVEGRASLSQFATEGVMWGEVGDSQSEEVKCPNCWRYFALDHFQMKELARW